MGTNRPVARMARSISTATTARAPHEGSDAVRGFRGRGFLTLLLALVLAVGLVPAVPLQAFGAFEDSGIDGGCTWIYKDYNNNTLTIKPTDGISGQLSEHNTTPQRGWLAKYADLAKSITVEPGVTAQGDMQSLFAGMTAVTSVVLPNEGFDQGIKNAQSMFSGCKALTSITLPDDFGGNITNAKNMFSGCQALESIDLRDGFGSSTLNATDMFLDCSVLSIVYLGENCNGSLLAQVPDTTRNEYIDKWICVRRQGVENKDVAAYKDGKTPSELPTDYEDAGELASEYARQHAGGIAPSFTRIIAAGSAPDAITITLDTAPPSDAFVSYSLDGKSWQDSHILEGLNTYTTYDEIEVRYSSPAYDTEAKNQSPLSATTYGRITYEPNGGSGATKPTDGESGSKSAPAAESTFTRPQYKRFKEWSTSSDGKGASYQPGDQVPFEQGGNTLFAIWKDYAPPKITTTALPSTKTGDSYHQKLTASGDEPMTWSITAGELPAGLTLSPDGIIFGTPSAKGVFPFTVKVANDLDDIDTADYAITVVGPPVITISSDTLPAAEPGKPYRFHFTSDEDAPATDVSALSGSASSLANAPGVSSDALAIDSTLNAYGVSWSLEAGALPSGLSLAPDGELSGTPHGPGTYTFTVKATNRYGSTAQTFHLAVNSPVTLVATGDNVAGPTAGLVALSLFCAASITVLSLRRRARRR